jgi:hypothetical protein
MEAQRRLAKRRMVGLAEVGSPAAFDIGVLFSNGPPRREELNWQAPASKEKLQTATSIPSPPAMNSSFKRFLNQFQVGTVQEKDPQALLKTQLETLKSLKWAQMLAQSARTSGMDPAQYSQLAFKALLANQAPLPHLLGFLKDPSLNLPQVRNATLFIAHYHGKGRNVPTDFTKALPQLLSLGMVEPAELLQILSTLPAVGRALIQKVWEGMKACRVTSAWTDCAHRLLEITNNLVDKGHWRGSSDELRLELYQHAFPMGQHRISEAPDFGHHLAHWVSSVHRRLENSADCPDRSTLIHIIALLCKKQPILLTATADLLRQRPSIDSDLPEWKLLINDWLAMLLKGAAISGRGSQPALPRGEDPRQLDEFYKLISEYVTPRDLAPFFKSLPTFTTSCIIAQEWIPRLCAGSWSPSKRRDFECNLRVLQSTDLRPRTFIRRTDHFADIVIALARRGHVYEPAMAAIVDLCHAIYGTQGAFDLVRSWRYAQIRIIPEVFGDILRSLSQTEPWTALALYRTGRLWVGSSPELLPKLIEQGMCAYKVFEILNHKDPTNSVPVDGRDKPFNNLHHTRNTLVHVVADALSRSQRVRQLSGPEPWRSLRSRQIFRNVYLAYRYLVERQSPVRPLMSRALIRAGIIRPLERYEWVCTARIRWLLHIVGRVEGEEVASELDKKIYEWRGKVHRFIMSNRSVMRTRGIHLRRQQDARERLKTRACELRSLRSCRGMALTVGNGLNEDPGAPGDGLDALSLLEENLSSTTIVINNAAQQRQSIKQQAHSETFDISPQFQDLDEGTFSPLTAGKIPTTSTVTSTRHSEIQNNAAAKPPLGDLVQELLATSDQDPILLKEHGQSAFSKATLRGSIRGDLLHFQPVQSSLIRYQFFDGKVVRKIKNNSQKDLSEKEYEDSGSGAM